MRVARRVKVSGVASAPDEAHKKRGVRRKVSPGDPLDGLPDFNNRKDIRMVFEVNENKRCGRRRLLNWNVCE